MLGWAPSVFALMLVSCASSPEATTTTTRQTTGTTPVHPPPMAYDYHIMTYTPLEREDGTELSVRAKTTKEKTT